MKYFTVSSCQFLAQSTNWENTHFRLSATAYLILTELTTLSAYNISARTAQKTPFRQFYCCVTQMSQGPRREHRVPVSPLVGVRKLLPSNRRCLQGQYWVACIHATLYFHLPATTEGHTYGLWQKIPVPSPTCSLYYTWWLHHPVMI
jgi:hypothetical protein